MREVDQEQNQNARYLYLRSTPHWAFKLEISLSLIHSSLTSMSVKFIYVMLVFIVFAHQTNVEARSQSTHAETLQAISAPENRLQLLAQTGDASGVYVLDFSHDGRLIATGGRGGVVSLWDVSTGRQLRNFGNAEFEVALSPSGNVLLTGGRYGIARLWETSTGREIRRFEGHERYIRAVAFSPNGDLILTGSGDSTARLWNVSNGKEIVRFEGHKDTVDEVTFSQDGKFIITGSRDGTARLWNSGTGREIIRFDGHSGGVWAIVFGSDGNSVFTATHDGMVRLWNVSNGREIRRYVGHKQRVSSVALSPDGRFLLTGSFDGTAALWNVSSGERLRDYGSGSTIVRIVAFFPDGRHVLVGRDFEPAPEMFETLTGDPVSRFKTVGAPIGVAIFSPDGRSILTGSSDGIARLWDLSVGREIRRFKGHSASISSVAFFPKGDKIVTGSNDNTSRLWDLGTGNELQRFEGDAAHVTLSRDGQILVTGSTTIKFWDIAKHRVIKRFGGKFGLYQIALSPDERYILTGGDGKGKGAHLYEVSTGQEVRHFKPGPYQGSVAFSPDGETVLTAGAWGNTTRLWDIVSGLEIQKFEGHAGVVNAVTFSPDGKFVLTASSDNTARLWDVTTGEERMRLEGHSGIVSSVSFSADGRFVLTGSLRDQTCRLWDASTGEELVRLISFRDGSWAVVDTEGRFDASNGGDIDGLHWVMGFEPIVLNQLKERYYDPGLLSKKLGFNSQPLRNVKTFTNPKLYPLVETEPLEPVDSVLRIKLTNRGGGIGRVVVSINGKEVTADARGPGFDPNADAQVLKVPLSDHPYLIPGEENIIEVQAFNAEGYLSSRGVRIMYQHPGKAPIKRPTLWAIVAGISDYEGERIDLRYAAKDAQDIAKALKLGASRLFGWDKVHLTLLTADDRGMSRPPTKAEFEQAFAEFRTAKPWDILMVYLAGHGVAMGGSYYYLTKEARSTELSDPAIRARVAVSSDELVTWLKQSPALKQAMVLDTCAAGSAATKLVEKRYISSDQIRAIERLKDRTGFHVLMGSAADAVSYEATQYGQGLLTYALLQGMRGAALREGEYVDISTLFQHAADEVPKMARHLGGIQRPQIAAPRGTSFDIGQLKAEDRQAVPLSFSKHMLLQPMLQNATEYYDNLELTVKIRQQLREESYASSRGYPTRLPAIYVNADQLAGAILPSGSYSVKGDTIEANLVLVRDGKRLTKFKVQGTASNLEEFTLKVIDEIARAIEKIQ